MTFTEFITAAKEEVDYKADVTESFLKRATVAALRYVSAKRVTFMDATTSFETTAGVSSYGSTTTGFPVDAASFVDVWVNYNGAVLMVTETTIREIRRLSTQVSASLAGTIWPEKFAWFAEQMHFPSQIAGDITIHCDYYRNALRDSKTGTLITVNSDTETNPWLESGSDLLMLSVLWSYFGRIQKDTETAGSYAREMSARMTELEDEWAQNHERSVVAQGYL